MANLCGWQVHGCFSGWQILVGWRVQEDGWVLRLDNLTKMVDVLFNPWKVSWFSIETIGVLRKAVSLQGMRQSDVRARHLQ
jgi:hypothetical protein